MSSTKPISSTHDCDAIQNLIPDYAFGLTNADETRLVEANLPLCPDAATQLADYRQLQASMRADVPQIDPPLDLEEHLMGAIAAPAVVPQPARRRLPPLVWVAAAAVLLLVATNIYWLLRVNDLSRRQDELISQNRVQEESAFILTNTNTLRWVRLPPAEQTADTSAFLMWNAESKIGLLYVRGFPELATGKTYQLWLTRAEERASAGTFSVDDKGIGVLLFHSTKPIDEFTWARITSEPANGSEQPTGAVVVNGEL